MTATGPSPVPIMETVPEPNLRRRVEQFRYRARMSP
jgi:hypothetical protein